VTPRKKNTVLCAEPVGFHYGVRLDSLEKSEARLTMKHVYLRGLQHKYWKPVLVMFTFDKRVKVLRVLAKG